ncbi:MAG: metallophosphoesterase [Candidatus Freyarchaeota archaeon]|nr:metallophosphoesterase [Candidatus Jordarchaeia archaeon]
MKERVLVAHISDIHLTSGYFSRELGENVVEEVNRVKPDLLVVTGDLTDNGHPHEYREAKAFLDRFKVERVLVVLGNHDSRNAGYMLFEELFGSRYPSVEVGPLRVVGVDSTEPDLDDGHIGRLAYRIVEDELKGFSGVKAVALHHHLVPIPGTGRERNIPSDSGDFLKLLSDLNVHLVLCGHKHVPWFWKLNEILIINAGTATTLRLKAHTPPSFNLITVNRNRVVAERVNSETLERQPICSMRIEA